MRLRVLTIQRRIFAAFSLFFTMVVAVGGWGVARYFTSEAMARIEQRQFEEVNLLAQAMDDKFLSYLGSLNAVATGLPLRALHDQTFAQTWIKDRRGIRSNFENGLFLFNPEGRVLAEDAKVPMGRRIPAPLLPFLQSVMKTRKAAVSEVYPSEVSGKPAVLMAAPCLDKEGRLMAVLAGGIDLLHDDFLGSISHYRSSDSGYLQLFDSQRRMLTHPDGGRLLKPIGPGGAYELFDRAIAGFEGSGERINSDGVRTLSSLKRLRSIDAVLAASIPMPQAFRPIDRFRAYLKLAVAIAITASLFLTWLISHRLADNLRDVTEQVRALGDRPAGQRVIQIKDRDEASILAESFNGMIGRLEAHEARLLKTKRETDEELAVTKHILHRLVEPGLRALPPHFHMETLQTQRINGDACTYRQGLPGVHFGFICDATGHGLVAGVSTIPAVQTFLHMAKRNIPLDSIYRKINERLRQMLPPGKFVCLMLIRLDVQNGSLSVLNAGLPDAIFSPRQGAPRNIQSRNLPAGVVDVLDRPVVEHVAAVEGDRILAFTDGFQELLGDRIPPLLAQEGTEPFADCRSAIQAAMAEGGPDHEQADDVSWALWEVPPRSILAAASFRKPGSSEGVPLQTTFSVALTLDPTRHTLGELLPDGLRLLGNQGMSPEAGQMLGMALSEAISNAVDHGLLGLDSTLKQEGFETYLATRRERLAALKGGQVHIRIDLRSNTSRRVCEIAVKVEDTGPGFDWRAWQTQAGGEEPRLSGRGLMVLRAISKDMGFNEAGNAIHFTLSCT